MISVRRSPETQSNPRIREVLARPNETNGQWLARIGATGGILLLGGTSLVDFRIRVAQSHLRHDMSPSLWSLAGILRDARRFESAPLGWRGDISGVPTMNAVQRCRMADYDDPVHYPNIAVLHFTRDMASLLRHAGSVRDHRSALDLPHLMVAWLGFVWGAGRTANPLLAGIGLPSAAFVETAHALAGIDLTPGVSSESSCPEAIWQAAKWWQGYYAEAAEARREQEAGPIVPEGSFTTRQRAAALYDRRDVAAPRQAKRGARH